MSCVKVWILASKSLRQGAQDRLSPPARNLPAVRNTCIFRLSQVACKWVDISDNGQMPCQSIPWSFAYCRHYTLHSAWVVNTKDKYAYASTRICHHQKWIRTYGRWTDTNSFRMPMRTMQVSHNNHDKLRHISHYSMRIERRHASIQSIFRVSHFCSSNPSPRPQA